MVRRLRGERGGELVLQLKPTNAILMLFACCNSIVSNHLGRPPAIYSCTFIPLMYSHHLIYIQFPPKNANSLPLSLLRFAASSWTVLPHLSATERSAPCSASIRIAAAFPSAAAMCEAVRLS